MPADDQKKPALRARIYQDEQQVKRHGSAKINRIAELVIQVLEEVQKPDYPRLSRAAAKTLARFKKRN